MNTSIRVFVSKRIADNVDKKRNYFTRTNRKYSQHLLFYQTHSCRTHQPTIQRIEAKWRLNKQLCDSNAQVKLKGRKWLVMVVVSLNFVKIIRFVYCSLFVHFISSESHSQHAHRNTNTYRCVNSQLDKNDRRIFGEQKHYMFFLLLLFLYR